MLDNEMIKFFASLGVGGIVAGLMFAFYRKDIKQFTELWRNTSELLMGVVKENTASNTKLSSLLENQERNSIRKADLLEMIQQKLDSLEHRKNPNA